MMKAIVFEGKDHPLKYASIANDPREGMVKLTLKSAALNRRDYWITLGLYPGKPNLPTVLGSDGCGLYEGKEYIICPNVDWGEKSFPSPGYVILGYEHFGTFAESIYVPSNKLYPKPSHLTVEQAAAIPLAGLTAYRALVSRCGAKKNDRVLISGIGGGVALFACQFALALGCEVYVTSGSSGKIEKAKELGVIEGVNYKDPSAMIQLAKKVGGFDVVIDSAGGPGFNTLLKMCRMGANVGIYGGTVGNIDGVSVPNLFFKQISIHGSTMGSDQEFAAMLDLINKHKIIPIVDRRYDLSEGVEAVNSMKNSSQFGKIVLDIA